MHLGIAYNIKPVAFRVPNIQITMDHGDRFRPLTGVVGPLPNGGDPKYLLTGMILQELNPKNRI